MKQRGVAKEEIATRRLKRCLLSIWKEFYRVAKEEIATRRLKHALGIGRGIVGRQVAKEEIATRRLKRGCIT